MRRAGSRRRPGYARTDAGVRPGNFGTSADDVAFAADDLARDESRLTFEPTSTISPTNSCPMTIGTGMVFRAHSSQS